MKTNTIYRIGDRTYEFKEIKNIVKKNGKETNEFITSSNYWEAHDKLKDSEFIFCLTYKIENTNVFMFFKKNERTDKEVALPIILFKQN